MVPDEHLGGVSPDIDRPLPAMFLVLDQRVGTHLTVRHILGAHEEDYPRQPLHRVRRRAVVAEGTAGRVAIGAVEHSRLRAHVGQGQFDSPLQNGNELCLTLVNPCQHHRTWTHSVIQIVAGDIAIELVDI